MRSLPLPLRPLSPLRSTGSRLEPQAGTAMLEIVVAVVILGVIASIAAPHLFG